TLAQEPRAIMLAPLSEVPLSQVALSQGETFIPLQEYLKKKLKRPVRLVFTAGYQDLLDQFGQGKIDIIFGGPYTFWLAQKNYGAKPLVMRQIEGKSDYKVFIFAKEGSGINELNDLKGKRFAFTDELSTSGYLVPRVMLHEAGIPDPNLFFSKIKFKGNYNDIVEAVLQGEVDAAATASFQYESFGFRNRSLRTIAASRPLNLGPVFANPSTLSSSEMDQIKQAFLDIGKETDTQSLSKILGMQEFFEPVE